MSTAFWDSVPDSGLIPEGKILFAVESTEDVVNNSGNKMLKVVLVAQEPEAAAGMKHTENFTFGTEADPMALRAETWATSIGARMYKNLLAKAQVPMAPTLEATVASSSGALVVAKVIHKPDNSGIMRARLSTLYKVGECQPALDVKTATPAAPTRMAAPPTPPAPPTAPASVPLTPPSAAPPAPVQTAAPEVLMVECPLCHKMVPQTELATHIAACAAGR